MKKTLSFFISIGLLSGSIAFARGVPNAPVGAGPATVTVTPTDENGQPIAVTTTTMPGRPNDTIQTLAERGAGNTGNGSAMASAALTAATVYAAASCPKSSKCGYWLTAVAAAGYVLSNMNKASGTSHGTGAAVTVTDTSTNPVGGDPTPGGPSAPPLPNWESDPNWRETQRVINNARNNGWQVDTATGKVTSPDGKTFGPSTVNSAAGMKASGATDAQIKEFQEQWRAGTQKALADALKKTQSTDMFGDSVGGEGGGSKSSASADNFDIPPMPGAAGPQLGIDRNPAQVVGMKKMFNGEPIGVSADSAFDMINRRYGLHHKNGSFLPPQ